MTLADYGKGKVIYVGTLLEPRFYADLAARACDWAKVARGPEIPPGVDFTVRQGKEHAFRFVLNFSASPQSVLLPGVYRDPLSGKAFNGNITVPSLDLCVLVEEKARRMANY